MTNEWLRSKPFDMFFILGISAIAIISGAAVIIKPELFPIILMLDLWFLGYHHVISTYTRIGFSVHSLKKHKLLVTVVPIAVIASVAFLANFIGLWAIASIYFYWQWYHYTRQSWGISQFYKSKSNYKTKNKTNLSLLLFWSLPVWGMAHRSFQAPEVFLGQAIVIAPIPEYFYLLIKTIAIVCLLGWVIEKVREWQNSKLPVAHTLYMLSHFSIFYISYVYISDITTGWLVVNIWHNAQYIIFVWLYNNNKYKTGVDENEKVISTLSQTKNIWLYFIFCLTITTAIYHTIDFSVSTLAAFIIIYQSINFHHYIVDSQIWKVRKKPIRTIMGIQN